MDGPIGISVLRSAAVMSSLEKRIKMYLSNLIAIVYATMLEFLSFVRLYTSFFDNKFLKIYMIINLLAKNGWKVDCAHHYKKCVVRKPDSVD